MNWKKITYIIALLGVGSGGALVSHYLVAGIIILSVSFISLILHLVLSRTKIEWELVEEGIKGTKTVINPMLDFNSKHKVVYDLYKRKKKDGTWKYKQVEQ